MDIVKQLGHYIDILPKEQLNILVHNVSDEADVLIAEQEELLSELLYKKEHDKVVDISLAEQINKANEEIVTLKLIVMSLKNFYIARFGELDE